MSLPLGIINFLSTLFVSHCYIIEPLPHLSASAASAALKSVKKKRGQRQRGETEDRGREQRQKTEGRGREQGQLGAKENGHERDKSQGQDNRDKAMDSQGQLGAQEIGHERDQSQMHY